MKIGKVKFLLLILVCSSINNLFSQSNLRDVVVVVRPVYSDVTVNFLKDFAKSLRRDGYALAANVMDSYAEGGFGTGIVYKYKNDSMFYVITNRHVVSQAEYVNIEISRSGNNKEQYDRCKIIAIHKELDLALIALPGNVNFEKTLQFLEEVPEDGTEVFSAGFPGLGNDPSWQLGKGIISNSDVFVEEFTNGSPISIIQHTAQVDPGSSGGPLMVKNEDVPFKYEVIGINTWKVIGRENANFSIPSFAILKFINDFFKNTDRFTEEDLEQNVNEFIEAVATNYKKVLPFISYGFISKVSVNSFYEILNTASKAASTEIRKNFNYGSPIEGVRIGLADAIYRNFGSKSIILSSIENFNSTGDPVNVLLKVDGKTVKSIWVAEQGNWKLIDFDALNMKALGNDGVVKSYGRNFSLGFGLGVALNSDYITEYNLTIEYTSTFFTFGTNIYYGRREDITTDYVLGSSPLRYDTTYVKRGYGGFYPQVGGRIPIKISSVYIVPYFKLFAGVNGDGHSTNNMNDFFCYGFIIGGELSFKITRKNYLFGGLEFKKRYLNSHNVSFIDINVGIAF